MEKKTPVRLPSDVLERNDVLCTRGPLGIQFNQTSSGIVVVVGFTPVDGTRGEIERSGLVREGDALLCINEIPIELETYSDVLSMLREGFPIKLTFGRTGEELAMQVREDVIRRALQLREKEEFNRLKELETARLLKAKDHKSIPMSRVNIATSATNPIKVEIDTSPNVVSPTVYTAKDFKASKFTTFQKQIGIVLILLALFRTMYAFTQSPTLVDVVPEEGEFIVTEESSKRNNDNSLREDSDDSSITSQELAEFSVENIDRDEKSHADRYNNENDIKHLQVLPTNPPDESSSINDVPGANEPESLPDESAHAEEPASTPEGT